MSNALVAASANAVATYGGSDPYAAAAREMGGGNGGGKFMQFNGKTGRYSVKKDELPSEMRLVFNPDATERGGICWVKGEVKKEVMVNILSGPAPNANQLQEQYDFGPYEAPVNPTDPKDGWVDQSSVRFANPESGEEYILKMSSESGRRAIGAVLSDYSKMRAAHPGMLPIVTNGARGFTPKNSRYTVYAPEFKIVGWMDPGQLAAAFSGGEEDYGGEVEREYHAPAPQHVEQAAPAPVVNRAPPPVAARPAPPPAGAPRPRSF